MNKTINMLIPIDNKKIKRKFAKTVGVSSIFLGIFFYIVDNMFAKKVIIEQSWIDRYFSFSSLMILTGVILVLPDIIYRIKDKFK